VDLPPVKSADLAALVASQARRFFRANGHPLVTDAVWLASAKGSRVARAAAAEEQWLDAIVAGARAASLALETIDVASAPSLKLLPSSERVVRRRSARLQLRKLAIVAAAVWLLAVGTFAVRLTVERRRVILDLASLQAPVAAVLDARRELRDAAATVQAIREAQASRGGAVAALLAVTAGLPDSAVLTSFTWSADGTGALSGDARRAADVLARLERTHGLPNPRFDGAITREMVGGREWERFTMLFGREPGNGTRGQ
jgi:Tfp pilus assembly protein PilN